jgi:hypothetical protein
MKQIRTFLRLPIADQLLFMRIALLLAAIRIGLSLFSWQAVQRFLDKVAALPGGVQHPRPDDRLRVIDATVILGRFLLGDKPCLTQALTVMLLFRRRKYPAQLKIGVAKRNDGALIAHAWVESGGEVVIGGVDSPHLYTTLLSLKGA